MHFGLEKAAKVDMVEIRWLSGQIDQLKDLDVNRLYVIQEGGKILKAETLKACDEIVAGWLARRNGEKTDAKLSCTAARPGDACLHPLPWTSKVPMDQ